jgi:predicted dienelactone hydrolase
MKLIFSFLALFLMQSPVKPSLPSPTGPYAIGRVQIHWVDEKRPDLISNGHRELSAYIWYPAAAANAEYAAYMPNTNFLAGNPSAAGFANLFGPVWTEVRAGLLRSHAFDSAPLARIKDRLPVVIFSAGGGGTPVAYTTQMEELASHGYLVVGVEHTYDSTAVIFPDGRVVPYAAELWSKVRKEAGGDEETEKRTTEMLAADISSTIDKLIALNADGGSIFHSRLDTTRIGAFGHSRGGRIAAGACQIDRRIKACANEDGNWSWQPFWFDERGRDFRQPFMMLDHLDAELPDAIFAQMGTTREAYAQQRAARQTDARERLYSKVAGGAYHVTITTPGISHNSFSDVRLLGRADAPSINVWPIDVQAATPHAHILYLINMLTMAFFDTYLRGNSTPQFEVIGGGDVSIERFGKTTR